MSVFAYKKSTLHCESVPLDGLAERFGTPLYVYSHAEICQSYRRLEKALEATDHLLCYSLKPNANLAVARLLVTLGAGLDVFSEGELLRALRVGADPKKIVFGGVGKTAAEIDLGLRERVLMLNIESAEEIDAVAARARALGIEAPISLRVNPDVDPKTHPYISTGLKENKFGIEIGRARALYQKAAGFEGLRPVGVDCHIGSQVTEIGPFVDALARILDLVRALRNDGIALRYLDLGGGLGIPYENEEPPSAEQYAGAIRRTIEGEGLTLILEPGRMLVGNAGVMLTRVLYRKENQGKKFVIVDAGMNDLLRPSLYGAYHEIRAVSKTGASTKADVVGPVCESGDFIAREREVPDVEAGGLLAVMSAGAYGFVMSSNYNSRARPAEVLVRGGEAHLVRARESIEDLMRGEEIPGFLRG